MSFDYTQEDIEQFSEIITSFKKKMMFEKFLKDLFFALVEYNDTRKDLSYMRTPRSPHKIDFKYQVSHHNELNYDTYSLEILIDKQPQSQMDIKVYDYSEALKIPFDKENLQKRLIEYGSTLWIGLQTKSYIMNSNLPSIRYFSVANKKFINEFVQNYNFGG